MKVNISDANTALISLFGNPSQIVSLDANFLIPPNRNRICKMGFDYSLFKDIWLDPIFAAFPKIAIHEAVYDELVMQNLRNYVDLMLSEKTAQNNYSQRFGIVRSRKNTPGFNRRKNISIHKL